ncbi:MAG: type IV secretion system DNA-binding domain-containing protein [Acidobacteriaceae bacterium]
MDEQQQSQSDINWSNGERPGLSALAATLGGLAGYTGGLQLYAHFLQSRPIPWIPARDLLPDLWLAVHRFHGILPGTGGWLPAACAGFAAVVSGTLIWIASTRENERHLRGIRLHRNPKKAARALAPARGEQAGIALHPKIRISEHQECRHILIAGGAGSGKTTILWPILSEIVSRGDKALIFDFKGDFTSSLRGPLTLLAPADERSARWIVGRDVETRLEAEALSETLIPLPQGDGAIWARGARGLLIGLISHLQTTKPHAWDFADLAQIASETLSNYKKLVEIVEREHPPAKAYLMGRDSRTTMGFLAELAGALSHVISLGVSAAASNRKAGTWSVKEWLREESKFPRTVVLGYRPASKELSQAFLASIIEQVVRQIASMSDCRPDVRRIWLVLDEVPQSGRVPSISDALVTLRSKGCRVILGLQSIAQIEQVYDRHVATIWASSTATKIICAVQSPSDQRWASDLVGEREVERFHGQTQLSAGSGAASRSSSWHRVREPVLLPAQFGQSLGIQKSGPRAVLLGGGQAALLDWPFPEVQKLRKDRVDAPWVKVGYKRPTWGAVPPPVAAPPDEDSESTHTAPSAIPNSKKPLQDKPSPAQEPKAKAKAALALTAASQKPKAALRNQESPDPVMDTTGSTLLDAVVPGAGIISDLAQQILDAAGMGSEGPVTVAIQPGEFPRGGISEGPDSDVDLEPDNEQE